MATAAKRSRLAFWECRADNRFGSNKLWTSKIVEVLYQNGVDRLLISGSLFIPLEAGLL
jgi:hypothetical protein